MPEQPSLLEEQSFLPDPLEAEAHRRLSLFVCKYCRTRRGPNVDCQTGAGCKIFPDLPPGQDALSVDDAACADAARKRRRGGQPGNANAVTHGFYARKLREPDALELGQYPFRGLEEEILILRYFIRRVVEHAAAQNDLGDAFHQLRAVSLASASITRLLRTQVVLSAQEKEQQSALLLRLQEEIAARDKLAQLIAAQSEPDPPPAPAPQVFYRGLK